MAKITSNVLKVNEGIDVTVTDGAATQELDHTRSSGSYVLLIENTDVANACRVKFSAGNGMSAVIGDLDVDVAASGKAAVGYLETARFTNADSEVDIQVLDQDNTAFTGAPADVKLTLLELDAGLID